MGMMRIRISGHIQRHVLATVEYTSCDDFSEDTLLPLLGKKTVFAWVDAIGYTNFLLLLIKGLLIDVK
ncbi:hypothetical protein KDK_11410 [Dictyobacter kobayashii]|uniref:Uncharacterized protein n=1 Tax=Dictyobacter kobayashii TaxID=2014872 RepID=A0A402AE17_9CHLR|nr:hypothetical protein KDK_11410 [Dictyobacter kobayashii]